VVLFMFRVRILAAAFMFVLCLYIAVAVYLKPQIPAKHVVWSGSLSAGHSETMPPDVGAVTMGGTRQGRGNFRRGSKTGEEGDTLKSEHLDTLPSEEPQHAQLEWEVG
jgi:hypothetical protein